MREGEDENIIGAHSERNRKKKWVIEVIWGYSFEVVCN